MSVYRSIVAKLDALRNLQKDMYTDAQKAEYRDELRGWADKLGEILDRPVVEEGPDLTSRRTDGRCILHFDLDPVAQWTDEQTLEHFLRCTKSEDRLDQWRLAMARAGQGWRCIERDHEGRLEKYRQIARERTERAIVRSEAPEPRSRDSILLEYLLTEVLKVVKG